MSSRCRPQGDGLRSVAGRRERSAGSLLLAVALGSILIGFGGGAGQPLPSGSSAAVGPQMVESFLYVANPGSGSVSLIDIVNRTFFRTVSTGGSPWHLAATWTRVYAAGASANDVVVIDDSGASQWRISVGMPQSCIALGPQKGYVIHPQVTRVGIFGLAPGAPPTTWLELGAGHGYGLCAAVEGSAHGGSAQDAYVASAADSFTRGWVTAIDGGSNAWKMRWQVGVDPEAMIFVEDKLYVMNVLGDTGTGPGTLSSIDTATWLMNASIQVGSRPHSLAAIGRWLFVANSGNSTVTIVDTRTDTVASSMRLAGSELKHMAAAGNRLCVTSYASDSVFVVEIDPDSGGVVRVQSVPVGDGPRQILAWGTDSAYVVNDMEDTVWRINITTCPRRSSRSTKSRRDPTARLCAPALSAPIDHPNSSRGCGRLWPRRGRRGPALSTAPGKLGVLGIPMELQGTRRDPGGLLCGVVHPEVRVPFLESGLGALHKGEDSHDQE